MAPEADLPPQHLQRGDLLSLSGVALLSLLGWQSAADAASHTVGALDTVADLGTWAGSVGDFVLVAGYHSAGDGGGGLFRATVGMEVDAGLVFPGPGSLRWQRLYEGSTVSTRWFGTRGDGTSDDTAALQAALDCFNNSRDPHRTGSIHCPPGTYRITRTLTLDAYRTSLISDGFWEGSAVTEGPVLRVVASTGPEAGNSYGRKGRLEGLRIRGRRRPGVIGIDFNSTTTAANANVLLVRCALSSFDLGIRHANRAYNSTALHCEVFDCNICVACPAGFTDYGERITYLSCVLYNSTLAVQCDNGVGSLYFANTSFDYNEQLFVLGAGQIFCSDCHFESSRYHRSPIVIAASDYARLRIAGGYFLTQSGPDSLVPPFLAEVGAGAEIDFDGVSLGYTRTGSDCLFSGEGRFRLIARWIGAVHENPRRLHPERSSLVDGSFRQTRIVDLIWVTADGSEPVTDRHTTAGTRLALSTEAAHSGERCLRYSKRAAATAASRFVLLLLPITGGGRIGWSFWHRLGARHTAESVLLYWSACWATLIGLDHNRLPVIEYQESVNSAPFQASTRWQQITSGSLRSEISAPLWATHFLIEINGVQVDRSDVLFDDLQVWAG